MIKLKNKTIWWLILVVLLTIPSFTTLLQPGYFPMHDDLQVMRIYEMDKCFKDGQIPCRWVPDMGYGFGFPLYNYYPVMPYYLGEAIHLLSFSLIWSVKIAFILSLIVSGITMFLLSRKLWGNLGGVASSVLYVYAPYHAVDVYVRGALAESWSIAWAPAVFLAIYLLIKGNNFKYVPILSVTTALFLMSHNPLALMFVPIMAVWTILLLWQSKNLKVLPKLILGAFWGLGLAAFFTLPVLLESNLVHIETLFIGYFNYLAHFVDLKQLFISDFWGFGGSIWGENDSMSFQVGKIHTVVALASLPISILLWRRDRFKGLVLLFLVAVFFGYAFLIHSKSNFIWEKITVLQTLQFPWRILSVVIFAGSLAVGGLFVYSKKPIRVFLALLIIISAFVLYQPYFKIEKAVPLTDQEKLSGALWDLQRNAGIFDYLPKAAKYPPPGAALETAEVSSGSATISDFKRGTNWLEFKSSSSESATLKLPIIDFPKWKVFVDNKEINFNNENEFGQPTFEISPGDHYIFAKLYNTPVRILSNIVSLVSFIALIIIGSRILWRNKE